jgi:methyl-accepting chemotaxis protein
MFAPISNKLALRINTGLLLASVIGNYFFTIHSVLLLVMIVISILIFISPKKVEVKSDLDFEKVSEFATNIKNGNLNFRIMGVPWEHPMNDMAHKLNDALDQVQAYIWEVDAVLRLARYGKYHRRTMSAGLKGRFKTGLQRIDKSLELMEKFYIQGQLDTMFADLGQLKTTNLLKNLTANQNDLNHVRDEMVKVEDLSKTAVDNAITNLPLVREVVGNLDNVAERAVGMSTSSEELSASSIEISEMVQMITGVADEVKNLAATTSTASKKIAVIIKRFAEATNTMTENTKSMAESAQTSKDVVTEFEQSFDEFAKMAQTTYENVSKVKVICDASLTKVDHVVYMQKAYRVVEMNDAEGDEAQAVLVDDQSCRFGKWYESGDGKAFYSHLPVFSAIAEPHAEVHNTVQKIIAEIRNPDWKSKNETHDVILQAFKQAEEVSATLVYLVDQMAVEKEQFESHSAEAGKVDLF